ncbi:MAG TPA: 16S rRNA (guanine(527)-N(7))-methyltransferase RsmG [Acholeplasmataceae bacterium]|nr:16S rRNA (guanine(527)-N(7))-methyltransferase RsmG [Acholeplasmataceae bacterium]
MEFREDIRQHFKIDLSDNQLAMFEKYFEIMIEYNKHTNLTTITEKKDVYYKHFYDSLTLTPYIEDNKKLCDMGSGAGFPSIPLKIIYPNLKVTIIDSSNKRIKFLKELILELNLRDITLIHDGIEVYGRRNQKQFDYVTARALGKLNLILEMAIPMLENRGHFLAMKGSNGKEELNESGNTLKVLKSKVILEKTLYLPYDYGMREIYIIEKVAHVHGYPREYKQMLKSVL